MTTTANTSAGCGYAINWETAEDRVRECKEFLMSAPQTMDPERLQFLNEIYDEYRNEHPFIIRARLFERVLTKKKIFLDPNPLVGTLTGIRAGVYAYPEWNVSWIKDEMAMAKMSSLGEMKIPAETLELLQKTYKNWKGRTCIDVSNKMLKDIDGINPAPCPRRAYGMTTPAFQAARVWQTTSVCLTKASAALLPRSKNVWLLAVLPLTTWKSCSSTALC